MDARATAAVKPALETGRQEPRGMTTDHLHRKTNQGRHPKKRPSSNSCGRHFGGFLFLRFSLGGQPTRRSVVACSRTEMGLYLPQEKRIDGAKFSSRCRPPITAAPHAAAAPAANAAAKVNAIITTL